MAHIHEAPGQVDTTVAAYIVYERSVLLIDHIKLKKWLPIGGHIELDEDPEQALFREVEEESGLTPEKLEVYGSKPDVESPGTKVLYAPTFLDIHDISETHRHIGMTYLLKSSTNRIQLAEGEHNAIQWVHKDKLADPLLQLTPAVRFYASEAIGRMGWD